MDMRKWIVMIFVGLAGMLCPTMVAHGAKSTGAGVDYRVVPLPRHIEMGKGEGFVLNEDCRVVVLSEGRDIWRCARFLQEYVAEATGMEIAANEVRVKGKSIVLRLNPKMTEKEGYRISVTKKEVLIEGLTAQGVFYGIQTLRKAMNGAVGEASSMTGNAGQRAQTLVLPAVTIEDAPRFAYRGMHLDGVYRHDGAPQHEHLPLASDGRPGMAH